MLKAKEPEKESDIVPEEKELEKEMVATVVNGNGTEEENTILKGVKDHKVKVDGHTEAAGTTTTEAPTIEASS